MQFLPFTTFLFFNILKYFRRLKMKTKIKTNGRYFTKLRKKQNLTIKELSLKTGISESTLTNIENNKVIPRLRTLLKLVKFYNITFKELFENY